MSPFADPTPVHILERMHYLGAYTLSTGTPIQGFYLPGALTAKDSIYNSLVMFSLMRADIQFRIVVDAVPQQYGVIVMSKMPFFADISSGSVVIDWQSADPVLLDISSCESYEAVLPYMWINRSIPIIDNETNVVGTDETLGRQWSIRLNMLHFGTTDSTTSQTVSVKVYACFRNIQVAGPRNPDDIVFQSFEQPASWSISSAAVVGASALNMAGGLFNMGAQTLDAYNDLSGKVGKMSGTSNPQGMRLAPFGEMSQSIYEPTAYQLSATNSDSFVDPKLLNDHLGEPDHKIVDIVSKPCINFSTTVDTVNDTIFGVALPNRIFYKNASTQDGPVYSRDYASYLSRCFRYYRGGMKYSISFHSSPLNMFRFLVTVTYNPSCAAVSSNTNVDTGDAYSEIISVRGTTVFNLEVPYLNTKPWRSVYATNGEQLVPTLTVVLTSVQGGAGDQVPACAVVISKAAAEDFQFASPQGLWPDLDAAAALARSNKGIKTVVTAPVKLVPQPLRKVSSKNVHFQTDLNMMFSTPFKNRFGAATIGRSQDYNTRTDIIDTVEQLLRRFDYLTEEDLGISSGVSVDPWPAQIPVSAGPLVTNIFDYVCSLFRYYRGSIRLKICAGTVASTTGASLDLRNVSFSMPQTQYPNASFLSDTVSNGAAIADISTWRVTEVEIPFLSECLAHMIVTSTVFNPETDAPLGVDMRITGDTSIDENDIGLKIYRAAGKNFQLFYLKPLPLSTYWVPFFPAP